MATASQQLSALLHQACLAQPDVLAGFLNRLFNTLNWTVTEFTVSLKARSPAPRCCRCCGLHTGCRAVCSVMLDKVRSHITLSAAGLPGHCVQRPPGGGSVHTFRCWCPRPRCGG